jgi:hypothetical protein
MEGDVVSVAELAGVAYRAELQILGWDASDLIFLQL